MNNKLFLLRIIKSSKEYGWGNTIEATVIASDEKSARQIAYEFNLRGYQNNQCWLDSSKVSCEEIDMSQGCVIGSMYFGN